MKEKSLISNINERGKVRAFPLSEHSIHSESHSWAVLQSEVSEWFRTRACYVQGYVLLPPYNLGTPVMSIKIWPEERSNAYDGMCCSYGRQTNSQSKILHLQNLDYQT